MDTPLPPLTAVAGSPAAAPGEAGVASRRRALAGGLAVVGLVAVVKLLLHFVPTGLFGYGFFVDELYSWPAPSTWPGGTSTCRRSSRR